MACYLGEVLRESDVDEHGKLNGDDYLFGLDFGKRQTTFHGASHGQVMSPFSAKPRSPSGFEANGEESLVCDSPVEGSAWDRRGEGVSATAVGVLPMEDRCQIVDLCDSESDEDVGQSAVAWNQPKIGNSSYCDAGVGSSTMVNEEALVMFMEVTGERNRQKALYFFRGAGEVTEVAINHYFAFDHSKSSVFPMGDDSKSVTEDDVQVVSGGGRGVADAGFFFENGIEANGVDMLEVEDRHRGEFQKREPEEREKGGTHTKDIIGSRVVGNVAVGTGVTGFDSPGGEGKGDDRDPCSDGIASRVYKAGGIRGKAGNGCGSHDDASVRPLPGVNGDDGYLGAEYIRESPHGKPAQMLARPDRSPQGFSSLDASKSDQSRNNPRKERKERREDRSLVDGMGTSDRALSSPMSSANGERLLPAAVSSPSRVVAAGDPGSCASPQGTKKQSFMMASERSHSSNGVAKPSQPMVMPSPLGERNRLMHFCRYFVEKFLSVFCLSG